MLGADALGPRDTIVLGGRPPQLPGPRRQAHYGICKACGLNFTDTPPRGLPLALKATAVLLYVSGLSMNRTAKLLGVSTPSVQAWIEQFAKTYAQKPEPEGRAVVIELDEMWHYLKKSRTSSGSGRLGIVLPGGWWTGNAAVVTLPPPNG
jgi:transposase